METILITRDPEVAKLADKAGVTRIMVDLEILGKKERQGHLDTVISNHTINDVSIVNNALSKSKLLVRVNPLNKNSKKEIEEAIKRGADILMLPMFRTSKEVKQFVELIDSRATVCLLLETPEALVRIDDILQVKGIDEIHIGLNDLHLAMNLDFMFELLSGGVIEYLSDKISKANIPFGFGGIARLDQKTLLDARLILSEHVRLGSSMVILSRDFKAGFESYNEIVENVNFANEVEKINTYLKELRQGSNDNVFYENKRKLDSVIKSISVNRVKKKLC